MQIAVNLGPRQKKTIAPLHATIDVVLDFETLLIFVNYFTRLIFRVFFYARVCVLRLADGQIRLIGVVV